MKTLSGLSRDGRSFSFPDRWKRRKPGSGLGQAPLQPCGTEWWSLSARCARVGSNPRGSFILKRAETNPMSITTERKAEVIKTHARGEADTGSAEVQVAIMSERIANLTEHL